MMEDFLQVPLSSFPFWQRALLIPIFFLLAWLVHRLSRRIASSLVDINRFTSGSRDWRQERYELLQGLVASFISFVAYFGATFMSLALFTDVNTLIWIVGLLSAGFGFGSRELISDFLTGISFLFEDSFGVGEKVRILGSRGEVDGVVEAVNLRITLLRAPTGELIAVPNGEIRMLRNFSRGLFSSADIKIMISAGDLQPAMELLEKLGQEAVTLAPDLLEPWQLLSRTGELGQVTELTLHVRTRFGRAAETRPYLLALVHRRLEEAGIALVG